MSGRQPRSGEWWRDALPGEIPSRCASLARLAAECGWWVRVTYARGTPTGPRGEGLATVVKTVPRESEDGRVLMTRPPRKKDGTPGVSRPVTRKVVTDEPVIVDLVTLWLECGGRQIVATWENGKRQSVRSSPPGVSYSEAELKAVLRSDPGDWESLSVEIAARYADAV